MQKVITHQEVMLNPQPEPPSPLWDRCGNEFNRLQELIYWLIHHHPPPPPPDDWLGPLTEVAFGLQNVIFAAGIKEGALRTSLAKEGLEQAKRALSSIKVG